MALETGFNTIKLTVTDNDDGVVHFEASYPHLDYEDTLAVQEVIAQALAAAGKSVISNMKTPKK
jgi:hypothetical protein